MFVWTDGTELYHHGIKNQQWGVRNGPPYPLDSETHAKVVCGSISEYRKRMNTRNSVEKGLPGAGQKFISSSYENHPVESLESLAKIPEGYKLSTVRHEINHPNGEDDKGRHYNCPNCAIAFDMVERGYLVNARPKQNGSNVGDIEKAWVGNRKLTNLGINDFGREMYDLYDAYKSSNIFTSKKAYGKFFNAYYSLCNAQKESIMDTLKKEPDGSRGILVVGWRMDEDPSARTTAYHAMNYKVEGNRVVFFDAQSRNPSKYDGWTDSMWLMEDCDPREIYYMRTSDLKPANTVGEYVYSNRRA